MFCKKNLANIIKKIKFFNFYLKKGNYRRNSRI